MRWWICGLALLRAQELLPVVNIQAPGIQGIDRTVLQQLQRDITQYLSTNRFTEDVFEPQERIRCLLTIVITRAPSPTRFEGTCQVQAIRPVYQSTYETQTLNFQDPNFSIEYNPNQTLQFSLVNYVDNLTSLLNFYAYIIIGLDYDSFGEDAGIPYFQKAQQILNMAAPNANDLGWTPSGNVMRSRYWLVENLLNSSYSSFHKVLYKYHRQGLDKMYRDLPTARSTILECLQSIATLQASNPNTLLVRLFIDTKSTEILQIFRKATPEEKQQLIQYMRQIDPSNIGAYEALLQEE